MCAASSQVSYPPPLERFLAKLDPASDVFVAERYTAEIEKVLAGWSSALCGEIPNAGVVASNLGAEIAGSSWRMSEAVPVRMAGPLQIMRRSFSDEGVHGHDAFLAQWKKYFSSFSSLRVAEFEIYRAKVLGESPLRFETELRYDLAGAGNRGAREQRTGSWVIEWTRDAQQQWLVSGWKAATEVQSRLTGPGFNDVTARCLDVSSPGMAQLLPGIDHWRTAIDGTSGIDVYGNHGIAAGDIDGHGFDSFYVCQPSGLPNRLYRNRGDGTFEDITERSGVGLIDGTASALFADFMNRGKQDLLVVRTDGPLLFTNGGDGKFTLSPDAFHFARPPQGTFTSAAVADYDRDGYLDIYFCVYSYYQGLNQYQFPSPYYDAQNGPPNFLFRNLGNGAFEDVTVKSGMDQNNNRFSFAAEWCDYDNDGWPDLYVANDFGRKNLYRSNGAGAFKDEAAEAGVEDYGPGMSTCWLDYDNDGRQDLYVANMWLSEGKRITSDDQFLANAPPAVRSIYQKHNMGNSLYRNTGTARFEDRTPAARSAMGRWSWSCANWDFDHDGFTDLYVANGFVSGPNRRDLQSFFWRQVAQRSFSPEEAGDYEMAWNAVNELVRSDYSWSGYERNVFYANNRDGTFSDVSGALGLDFVDDCRAYALSDFDHDGRLEFALKNRTGPQLRIVRNDLENIGKSIAFRLKGTACNRDAIGASITIESDALYAPKQTRFLSAGSGFASQHTKELMIGLGSEATSVSVTVRWPNGKAERFENIPANHRVTIEEGRKAFDAKPFRAAPSKREADPAPLATVPGSVNTWLIAPLYGADIQLSGLKGESYKLSAQQGAPVLVTFFRSDCEESREQLKEWQQGASKLAGVGISVAAAAVNGAADKPGLEEFARAERIGFPILLSDERTTGAWNIQYRYLFDRRRNMPLPISFLIDKSGAIIRIYQGRVTARTVAEDCGSAPKAEQERFARALPFVGPYYGNGFAHNYMTYGIAFVQYGYLDEAARAFQRDIDANPAHASSWFNLGTIYLNRKDYALGRKYLTEAIRLNPNDAEAWNNLGMISGEERKYEEALKEFRESARRDPNYLLAVQNMVKIYEFQNRPADAQKDLEDLVSRAPGNADLHQGLAMTLIAQNDAARARDELETAVRLRPGDPDMLNNLGVVLLRVNEAQEALRRFDEARRVAPEFDRPYINTAMVLKSAGQPEKARQLLAEFLARHPDNAEVRQALAKVEAK